MAIAEIAKPHHVEILDIRREELDGSLLQMTLESLSPKDGQARSLPTLLLYDEAGLKLFEEITYLDEYYLTNEEIEVLTAHADKIVERIAEGSQLVELGSGNLRKVDILLRALEKAKKPVTYYALDLNLAELNRTFGEISAGNYTYVKCAGLYGTYDDGLAWLAKSENKAVPTCVMSMGSSLGNFSPTTAADFLSGFAKVMNVRDTMLVGLDACEDSERIYHAYNDSKNITEDFYRNGLDHANRLLGIDIFKQDEWSIDGVYNAAVHRHEAYYVALTDVSYNGVKFSKGERLKIEEAYKYTRAQSDNLWRHTGLIRTASFGNKRDDYHLHMLSPYRLDYRETPSEYASQPVPSIEEWEGLWNTWDTVTRTMVPTQELLAKPINLRNNLIFYLGHIPTFADIHMTRATGEAATEPAYFPRIFERGIDPDVEDPSRCHDHSEIPDTWPPLDEILVFQNRVRTRARHLLGLDKTRKDRRLGRALWLAFEHEVMHLETFLYMLLQSESVLVPPATPIPNFRRLHAEARAKSVPNKWFTIPTSIITLGLDDPENDDGPDRYFGWDNERPSRKVTVPTFEAQARPITVEDYAAYLETNNIESLPVSWTTEDVSKNGDSWAVNGTNGDISCDSSGCVATHVSPLFLEGKTIRTIFGTVPLKYALTWPVMASYNELADYAAWMNGRIPTMEEARSIYGFVEELKKDSVEKIPSILVPAVNGHLSNEGVEETPPQGDGLTNGFFNREQQTGAKPEPTVSPDDLFINLKGCNVGFKFWHPVPVTPHGDRLCGQSDFGGVWEWTSSTLEKLERFKPMDLYPGYTADFFDGKHNIMLGGSWATHPRVAGRKTFINWYQRNYPFVWAGARLVRDLN